MSNRKTKAGEAYKRAVKGDAKAQSRRVNLPADKAEVLRSAKTQASIDRSLPAFPHRRPA